MRLKFQANPLAKAVQRIAVARTKAIEYQAAVAALGNLIKDEASWDFSITAPLSGRKFKSNQDLKRYLDQQMREVIDTQAVLEEIIKRAGGRL